MNLFGSIEDMKKNKIKFCGLVVAGTMKKKRVKKKKDLWQLGGLLFIS